MLMEGFNMYILLICIYYYYYYYILLICIYLYVLCPPDPMGVVVLLYCLSSAHCPDPPVLGSHGTPLHHSGEQQKQQARIEEGEVFVSAGRRF